MSEAVIEAVGVDELPLIVDLFNRIFRPAKTLETFQRRYRGRHNVLQLVGKIKDQPAGFFLGYELKPDTFYAWFYGVLSEHRRSGLGSQLMEHAQKWAMEQGYTTIRLECYNHQRPMLHLGIALNYDIIGIRWDPSRSENLVIFEKNLTKGR
jgi:ribosomal protein S18 acetylase RimI-like enzyme